MTNYEFTRARMALGLSGRELAAKLDMHPTTISGYETGKEPVPAKIELAMIGLKHLDEGKEK